MSTNARPPLRTIAVLKLPKYSVPRFISRARSIVLSMTGNTWFPSPTPPIATLEAALEALAAAEAATYGAGPEQTTIRDAKRDALKLLLEELRNQVQSVANANPEHAVAIIVGAGMHVKDRRTPGLLGFRLRDGRVSGEVDALTDAAGNRASYEWAFSLDGGITWMAWETTTKARTTIRGLPPGVRVVVRYRTGVNGVTSDWCQPLSIIVV
jgi:hypothetical protein